MGFVGGSGNQDGRSSGFNDLGQLVFSAIFSDGSSGIFVSDLVAEQGIAGDFDDDGDVDGADFLKWQRGESSVPLSPSYLANWRIAYSNSSDFDGDGDVDGTDFLVWQRSEGSSSELANWQADYGERASAIVATVPEPSSLALLALAGLAAGSLSRKGFNRGTSRQAE